MRPFLSNIIIPQICRQTKEQVISILVYIYQRSIEIVIFSSGKRSEA